MNNAASPRGGVVVYRTGMPTKHMIRSASASVVLISLTLLQGCASKTNSINLADFDAGTAVIIGSLGVPMGEIATLDGIIVERDNSTKSLDNPYRMAVTHVNGKALRKTLVIDFADASFGEYGAPLFTSPAEIEHELKEMLGRIPSEKEVAEVERKFIGTRLHVYAYECGRLDGVPDKLDFRGLMWAGPGYGFHTNISIVNKAPDFSKGDFEINPPSDSSYEKISELMRKKAVKKWVTVNNSIDELQHEFDKKAVRKAAAGRSISFTEVTSEERADDPTFPTTIFVFDERTGELLLCKESTHTN